ncbi:hypothetical protein HDU79_003530 [Rhizoclosmatium sp. JEL0117]|nr:hypothetical protein HDU79_003530 [Rhizoclosmatium sp. JEL0117]
MSLVTLPHELQCAIFAWIPIRNCFQLRLLAKSFSNFITSRHFLIANLSQVMSRPTDQTDAKTFETGLDTLFFKAHPMVQQVYAEFALNQWKQLEWSAWVVDCQLPAAIGALSKVVNIDLSFCELKGPIPPEVGGMTALKELYVHQNSLTAQIPKEFGLLSTNLRVLDLSDNSLSGSIPWELGNLTSLNCLYLSQNRLSGSIPASLFTLTKLRDLYIDRNELSGQIPSNINECVELRWLHLYKNRLSGPIPSEIKKLRHLESCEFRGNPELTMDFEFFVIQLEGDVDELE